MMLEHSVICPCCHAEMDMLIKRTENVQYFDEECETCHTQLSIRYLLRANYITDIRVEPVKEVALG